MSKKVLVVDKSLYNRMVLRDILITHGYAVVEASTAEAALEKYKDLHPDIVTVDAMLHDMSGANPIREIKLLDPGAHVLMVGTRGQRRVVIEAMALGAEGVLLKPFVDHQVIRALKDASGSPPASEPMY